jgi:hypothetical protein
MFIAVEKPIVKFLEKFWLKILNLILSAVIYGKKSFEEYSFQSFSTGLPTGYQQKIRVNVNKFKIRKRACDGNFKQVGNLLQRTLPFGPVVCRVWS